MLLRACVRHNDCRHAIAANSSPLQHTTVPCSPLVAYCLMLEQLIHDMLASHAFAAIPYTSTCQHARPISLVTTALAGFLSTNHTVYACTVIQPANHVHLPAHALHAGSWSHMLALGFKSQGRSQKERLAILGSGEKKRREIVLRFCFPLKRRGRQ